MGMYTGIRVDGKLKSEFIDEIKNLFRISEEIHQYNSNRQPYAEYKITNFWDESSDPFLKHFGITVGRASFIPFGYIACMPDSWTETKADFPNVVGDDGTWKFQCALKNYEDEIETWMSIVASLIFESCHIEYLYEEWYGSKQFELIDNKFVELENKNCAIEVDPYLGY